MASFKVHNTLNLTVKRKLDLLSLRLQRQQSYKKDWKGFHHHSSKSITLIGGRALLGGLAVRAAVAEPHLQNLSRNLRSDANAPVRPASLL
jgi:hypothetical protein